MALPASSTFTGGAEDPLSEGGNWGQDSYGGYGMPARDGSGNAVGTTGGDAACWTADTFGADHLSIVELSGSAWAWSGPTCRHNTSKNDWYGGLYNSTTSQLRLYKRVGGTYTAIATISATLGAGDKIKLEVTSGPTQKVYTDTTGSWSAALISETNADVSGNGAGIHLNSNSSNVTYWEGDDIGGGGGGIPIPVVMHHRRMMGVS